MIAALLFLSLGAGCMAAIVLLAWRKAPKASIAPFEALLPSSLALAAFSAASALWGFVAGMAALAVALYAACMAEAFAWRGLAALCKRKGKKARAEQFESYL